MHSAVEDIDGLDDVENSILYYNQAIIHYHMRQYSEAITIGEKLYQFLEPFGMLSEMLMGVLARVYCKNKNTPTFCCFSPPLMGEEPAVSDFLQMVVNVSESPRQKAICRFVCFYFKKTPSCK